MAGEGRNDDDMIKLPTSKSEVSRANPKTMIIFGQPKTGKTTALSQLDNCLTLDLERGSDFVSALKIDVVREAEKEEIPPLAYLQKVITSIREANKEKGGYVYKYIAVDTVSALEDLVLPLAKKLYKDTPMGRNWVGDDVTTLPNGAGYGYTRKAMLTVIGLLEEITDTLIIAGHVKDKLVEKEGKEMTERGLSLVGRLPAILCSKVDAVGYMYRKDLKTMINFAPTESLIVGGRIEHLRNKDICVAESNEDGQIKVDWSEIFKGE